MRRTLLVLALLAACEADRPPPQIFSCTTAPNPQRCERRRTRILYPNPSQRPVTLPAPLEDDD